LSRLGTDEKPAASPGNPVISQDISGAAHRVAEQINFLKTAGLKAPLRQASQDKGRIRTLLSLMMAREKRKFQQGWRI